MITSLIFLFIKATTDWHGTNDTVVFLQLLIADWIFIALVVIWRMLRSILYAELERTRWLQIHNEGRR